LIRFGIIGCGSAALPVALAMAGSSRVHLELLYDLDSNLANDIAGRYRARVVESLADLLADPLVDAVYIAVPHDLLHPMARQVLLSGKHALVEKPMALTVEQARDLIDLADKRKLALGVYYEMHHTDPCITARKLVRAGAIGKVIAVRIQTLIDKPLSYWQSGYTGRQLSPWRCQQARAGGGVLLMNTSHLLEAVRYITGLEVEQVTAAAGTLFAPAEVEVEDTAAAALIYTNGAIGSILAGAHLAGAGLGDECFDLYGSRGQLKIPDPYGSGDLQIYLRERWEESPGGQWVTLPGHPVDIHRAAVEEFVQAVESGERPPTDGAVALHILSAVQAIYDSSSQGRAVRLSEIGKKSPPLRR
jgi:predicted dehydrogenase